jgi:hypothetical protein
MTKPLTPIHICPRCGSRLVNKISLQHYFCADCCVEFDKNNNIYEIQYDGELVECVQNDCENKSKTEKSKKHNKSYNSCEHLGKDFIKLFIEGLSCYRIAQKYNISTGAVRNYLIKNNIYVAKGKGEYKKVS